MTVRYSPDEEIVVDEDVFGKDTLTPDDWR